MTEDSLHHMVSICYRATAVGLSWQVTYVAYSCSMLESTICQKFMFQRQVSD